MKIAVYCVGKLKEGYWKEAVEEYSKRLKGYAKLEIVECPDLATPEKASPAEEEEIKGKEGKKILERLKPGDFVVALDLGKVRFSFLLPENGILVPARGEFDFLPHRRILGAFRGTEKEGGCLLQLREDDLPPSIGARDAIGAALPRLPHRPSRALP